VEATKHTRFNCCGNRENGNCGQHRQKDLTFHHNSPYTVSGEIKILATNALDMLIGKHTEKNQHTRRNSEYSEYNNLSPCPIHNNFSSHCTINPQQCKKTLNHYLRKNSENQNNLCYSHGITIA
jgi:hypothetical protein